MSFFAELKRRNVFRVGVAYGIVAWLIAQIISVVQNPLHLPEWFATAVIVLLLVGFPLAIFFAWAYELTPEGIKVASSEGPAQFHTRTTGQRLNYFILGVVVLVVAFLLVDNYLLRKEPGFASTIPVSGESAANSADRMVASSVRSARQSQTLSEEKPVRRSSLILGTTQPFQNTGLDAYIALSRNGRQLAFAANTSGIPQIHHRYLDQLTARAIPGTDIGFDMFFSPDGDWLAYFIPSPPLLMKVAMVGGPPQRLAEQATLGSGGCWSTDGFIYFSSNSELYRIAAAGGTPEPVRVDDKFADWSHSRPYALPDKKHLLLTVTQGNARDGSIVLLNLQTGDTELLIRNGYNARYVASGHDKNAGHIVFMRTESLWAVPFDLAQLTAMGPEVPVINGVETLGQQGVADYAFSDDGLLVYLAGGDVQAYSGGRQLVWVDRAGKETPLALTPGNYSTARISPDGKQLALRVISQGGQDIWVYDLARGTLSRRTFSDGATVPLWTPDGKHIVFTFAPNYRGLAWISADGTGQPESLLEARRYLFPTSFTPDGAELIYNEAFTGPFNVYTLTIDGERTEKPLLATQYNIQQAVLSPDGRWIAYSSDETGFPEIYVRPFPDVEQGKWQVSTEGGQEPYWRADGKELFYRKAGAPVSIMAVAIESEPRFQAGLPTVLFSGDYIIDFVPSITYDVTADGKRFLMVKAAEAAGDNSDLVSRITTLVAVENWFDELNRLSPHSQ